MHATCGYQCRSVFSEAVWVRECVTRSSDRTVTGCIVKSFYGHDSDWNEDKELHGSEIEV